MATTKPLVDLARRQHNVFKLGHAYDCGLSRAAIRHLLNTERIWRVHPAVFALDGPLTPYGWSLAAVFACDPDAYSSRFTAAAILGYSKHWPERAQVTVVADWIRGPKAIDKKRARRLEVGTCRGIPVTSPAQTIRDCAPLLDANGLKHLLRQAEYRGVDLTSLSDKGSPRQLREALDRYVIGSGLTDSELEARFYELCATAGLPRPEIQQRFPDRRRVDFVWHDRKVIVETDGRRGHEGFVAAVEDNARDRAHLVLGYVTLRFTWWEIEHEPEMVVEQLTAVLSRR